MSQAGIAVIEPGDILPFLRRQARVIATAVALCLGGALIYLAGAKPVYRATALVQVDPSAQDLLASGPMAAPAGGENARVESEVELLRSTAVALATIEREELVTDPEFGARAGLAAALRSFLGGETEDPRRLLQGTLDRLQGAVSVKRRGLTHLITVTVDAHDPERAARLANALAETRVELQLQSKIRAALAGKEVLEGQLARARQAMAAQEQAVERFVTLNLDAREARARAAFESRDWQALADSLGDQAVAALVAERETLAPPADAVSGQAPDLDARLAEIDARIEARAEAALAAIGNNDDGAGDLSPERLAEVYDISEQADIAYRQYATLLTRARELETQALVQLPDVTVVSPALAPGRPHAPDTRLILSLALLGGVFLGGAVALGRERLTGAVTSARILSDITAAPVAAVVPNSRAARPADEVVDHPLSPYCEAIRQLRTGIDLTLSAAGGRGGKVIIIASALPGEGKSTLALSLARSYASLGRSTLLIDADLRRPAIARLAGLAPGLGLGGFLSDEDASGEGLWHEDPKSALWIAPGGAPLAGPADGLLQSARFHELVEAARGWGEVVIIDTPPLLPVVDARLIAPMADLAIHCLRFGETGRAEATMAHGQIRQAMRAGAPVLSVLNRAEGREGGAIYAGYYTGQVCA